MSKEPVTIFGEKSKDTTVYRHRIKPNDRLLIKFLNNYDIGQAAGQSATASANVSNSEKGYLINYDSSVTLPLIGRVNIVGLTRLEAAKRLEELYGKFIVNPIIEVNIISLSITILGEVKIPGKVSVDKENTTLIDVIAFAGGLQDVAKKYDIKIYRGKQIIVVDLRTVQTIYNQNIIMQDNDIIYVEPYGIKAAFEPLASIPIIMSLVITVSQLTILSFQLYTYIKAK